MANLFAGFFVPGSAKKILDQAHFNYPGIEN